MIDAAVRSLRELADDPLLIGALYHSPHLFSPRIAPSGAVSINAQWENGESADWFIEMQRVGAEYIQAGVICQQPDWIEFGKRIVNWGLARQGRDGSFPSTGDPYHSTELFVEGAARSALLLEQSGLPAPREWADKICAAATWLTNPEISGPGRRHNAPFVHRQWIMAAALGLAGAVAKNDRFAELASERADQGLSEQLPDGVNPERGGFDVNYQSAGLLFAARYHAVCPSADRRERVLGMIRRGLQWIADRVDAAGEVRTEGSTRVGRERLRSGAVKTVNEWELLQTFCYGAALTGEDNFGSVARRLARKAGQLSIDQLL